MYQLQTRLCLISVLEDWREGSGEELGRSGQRKHGEFFAMNTRYCHALVAVCGAICTILSEAGSSVAWPLP